MLIVRGGVWLGLCRGVGGSMVWNVFLGWAYEWDGLYEVTRVGSGELLARGFAFSDGVSGVLRSDMSADYSFISFTKS